MHKLHFHTKRAHLTQPVLKEIFRSLLLLGAERKILVNHIFLSIRCGAKTKN